MNSENLPKRRAMTPDNARMVRQQGHDAEAEFAELVGGRVNVYGIGRKKDVIDKQNNIHSVKSGNKKWQIFLYGSQRLQKDIDFQASDLLFECLNCFPDKRSDYLTDKTKYKILLQATMKKLKDYLNQDKNKIIFFKKAFLNNGEVDYLTIKEAEVFHIFEGDEAIYLLSESTTVENSQAKRITQMDEQKVIFKLLSNGTTIGEIELRNDSEIHYREIKFWMDREKTLKLLKEKIMGLKTRYDRAIVHGKAISKFQEL